MSKTITIIAESDGITVKVWNSDTEVEVAGKIEYTMISGTGNEFGKLVAHNEKLNYKISELIELNK